MKKNHLYFGDNLGILQKYIADESVDLVYLDPPFNSNRNYSVIFNRHGEVDRFGGLDTIILNLLSRNPPLLISLAMAGGRRAGPARHSTAVNRESA